MDRAQAWDLVQRQLDFQVEKWNRPDGVWPENIHKKNTILGEEVGEVANAILEEDWDNLRVELAQVAAVCVSIIMSEFPSNPCLDVAPIQLGPGEKRTEETLGHKGGRGWYHE